MRRVVNFISGAVVGALVGATVAILMAPASGEELRGQVRSRFDGFLDELNQAASARRIELERQLSTLRQPKSITAERAEAEA